MQWLFVSYLKSRDPIRRIEALKRLGTSREPSAISAVTSLLRDPVADVRVAAAEIASEWRDEAGLRALATAANDSEPAVREAAVNGLRKLGHSSAIPVITPLLCDVNAGVRALAARTLDQLGWTPANDAQAALQLIALGKWAKAVACGPVAVDLLLALLGDAAATVRREVVEALSAFPQPRVAEALAPMLSDSDSAVRLAALITLGRVGGVGSIAAITALTRDPDKNVRAGAVEAIGLLKQPDHVAVLKQALGDEHWQVRAAAVGALARSEGPAALAVLIPFLSDDDPDVRCVVAETLGSLRDEAAIEPLVVTQLDTETGVRQAALRALVRINSRWHRTPQAQRTLATLQRALRSDSYWVRHVAADLLAKIFNIRDTTRELGSRTDREARKRAHSLDLLVAALWDDDALLRGAATEALGRLGDVRAAEALTARLRDTNQWVRAAAAKALEQFNLASAAPEPSWEGLITT